MSTTEMDKGAPPEENKAVRRSGRARIIPKYDDLDGGGAGSDDEAKKVTKRRKRPSDDDEFVEPEPASVAPNDVESGAKPLAVKRSSSSGSLPATIKPKISERSLVKAAQAADFKRAAELEAERKRSEEEALKARDDAFVATSAAVATQAASAPPPPPPPPPMKRPRIRSLPPPLALPPTEFGPPTSLLDRSFNVSEIIPAFLFLGAGCEDNGRCIVNFPTTPVLERASRLAFFLQQNVAYCLNMAGSRFQKELQDMAYPRSDIAVLAIDVNDVAAWEAGNSEKFDQGAAFIQAAWEAHCEARKLAASSSTTSSSPGVEHRAPSIFVHCVAGVNRSPMVVVWWMCKHHRWRPRDAWDFVRERRDQGVGWTDATLKGTAGMGERREWYEALALAFPAPPTATSSALAPAAAAAAASAFDAAAASNPSC